MCRDTLPPPHLLKPVRSPPFFNNCSVKRLPIPFYRSKRAFPRIPSIHCLALSIGAASISPSSYARATRSFPSHSKHDVRVFPLFELTTLRGFSPFVTRGKSLPPIHPSFSPEISGGADAIRNLAHASASKPWTTSLR